MQTGDNVFIDLSNIDCKFNEHDKKAAGIGKTSHIKVPPGQSINKGVLENLGKRGPELDQANKVISGKEDQGTGVNNNPTTMTRSPQLLYRPQATHIHPGAYSVKDCSSNEGNFCEWLLLFGSLLLFILAFPIAIWFSVVFVQEYKRAIIFRMGRLRNGRITGPGVFFRIPVIDSYVLVDLRVFSYNIPPQQVLTKDSITATVDAVLFFRIYDPLRAIMNVDDYSQSTKLLTLTHLRNVLGTFDLVDILKDRETIARRVEESLEIPSFNWGIKVERIEMKDIHLPIQMQRAMALESEAKREAQAHIIAAQGELQASKSLKEAADNISKHPAALQLRFLQTLNIIAAEQNSTIIFPIPVEFLHGLK